MTEVTKANGMDVIAILVIASFAIDRIVAALLFLLSFLQPWAQLFPDPAFISDTASAAKAERKRKLIYFTLACVLCAAVLLTLPGFRVLSSLGYATNRTLDTLLTGMIVVGGSDRMADLLGKIPGAPVLEKPEASKPIEISGKLVLYDEDAAPRS